MDNSPINIAVDQLPSNYRSLFLHNLIRYVYDSASTKVTKELDNLIKLHGTESIIYLGKYYQLSYINQLHQVYRISELVKDSLLSTASEIISKKATLEESIATSRSIASKALALCKSTEDIKLLFTVDIFAKCDPYYGTDTSSKRTLSDETIQEFTEQNPNFMLSIKEQLLTNMLIY